MEQTFEVWELVDRDGVEITRWRAEDTQRARDEGMLSERAVLLHKITARTYEEMMAKHHELMGWKPYLPIGNSEPCPNVCGAEFYPMGSGECPNCGKIC